MLEYEKNAVKFLGAITVIILAYILYNNYVVKILFSYIYK